MEGIDCTESLNRRERISYLGYYSRGNKSQRFFFAIEAIII